MADSGFKKMFDFRDKIKEIRNVDIKLMNEYLANANACDSEVAQDGFFGKLGGAIKGAV